MDQLRKIVHVQRKLALCSHFHTLRCQQYTVSYLHHLYEAKESTFFALATMHNLQYMADKMRNIRNQILKDEL